jgi:hypothetical protein
MRIQKWRALRGRSVFTFRLKQHARMILWHSTGVGAIVFDFGFRLPVHIQRAYRIHNYDIYRIFTDSHYPCTRNVLPTKIEFRPHGSHCRRPIHLRHPCPLNSIHPPAPSHHAPHPHLIRPSASCIIANSPPLCPRRTSSPTNLTHLHIHQTPRTSCPASAPFHASPLCAPPRHAAPLSSPPHTRRARAVTRATTTPPRAGCLASSLAKSTRRRDGRGRFIGGCVGAWRLALWRMRSSRILGTSEMDGRKERWRGG